MPKLSQFGFAGRFLQSKPRFVAVSAFSFSALVILFNNCSGSFQSVSASTLASSSTSSGIATPTATPVTTSPLAILFPTLPVAQASYPQLMMKNTSFFLPSTAYRAGKKVFAHYMVCCQSFGGSSGGVAGAKQEILMAQSMGIDGFALNVGEWSTNANYPLVSKNFFEAALELGTNFSLFFSADMCCTISASDIGNMIQTFGSHPNYFKVGGRPMLSTFGGGGNTSTDLDFWKNQVIAPLTAAGMTPYFVPFFYTDPIREVPSTALVQANVAFWKSVVDGLFYFGAAGSVFSSPTSLVTANVDYVASLKAAGKASMASYTSNYWGNIQDGRRYFEFEGGHGTDVQWQALIKADPDFVELVTWNDINESYMSSIDDFEKYNDWGARIGFYKPHVGYGELNRYYIQWFKTGVKPTLYRESLFYFYRTHSKDLTTSSDPRGPSSYPSPITDQIYLTLSLLKPANLVVQSGSQTTTLPLPAGYQHVSVPFQAGLQHFELQRDGTAFLKTDGPAIDSVITLYDFWPTTGFIEAVTY